LGHVKRIICPGRAAAFAAALAVTLSLGGCGGIEFQGSVFDAMGLSGERKEPDPHMVERPPLLLPPNPTALPAPGGGVAVATAREDWPKNPEVSRKEVVQAQKDKAAKEESVRQPLHPYLGKPTLLNKLLFKKKEGQEVDDVPEPDPSDKPPEGEEVAQTKPKPLTPHESQQISRDEDLFKPAAPDSYKNPSTIY
jgi:hypothetical protein